MKILYVITGLGQGGAERVVCDLADKMYENGFEVKIAYLTGDILTHPAHKEVELIKINLNNIVTLPIAYLNLSRLIKQYNPDVVHSHMVHANILSRLIRINTPVKKLICTAHNSNEGGKFRMLVYRVTHRLSNLTTNVSNEASKAFIEKKAVPHTDITTIYNGIDLAKFYHRIESRVKILKELNLSNDSFLILAVGRFSHQKDYPNLLNAYKILKNSGILHTKLIVAGDGELRIEIETKILELDLNNDVILLGRRQDIPELMSAADLFVLPSMYEGFGLVVAEAMACETLVVATDCGGVSEVLNNTDFLTPPSNPHKLSEKILYCLNLNEFQKKEFLLKNSDHVRNNFSLDKIVKKWIELYCE